MAFGRWFSLTATRATVVVVWLASGACVAAAADARTASGDGAKAVVYVASSASDTIEIYRQGGNERGPVGSIVNSELTQPMALAVDTSGNLYVANCANSGSQIFVFPPGSQSPSFSYVDSACGSDVALRGSLLVVTHANFGGGGDAKASVFRIGRQAPIYTLSIAGAGPSATGVAFDAAGDCYIATTDYNNHNYLTRLKRCARHAQTQPVQVQQGSEFQAGIVRLDRAGDIALQGYDDGLGELFFFHPGQMQQYGQIPYVQGGPAFSRNGESFWSIDAYYGRLDRIRTSDGKLLTWRTLSYGTAVAAFPPCEP